MTFPSIHAVELSTISHSDLNRDPNPNSEDDNIDSVCSLMRQTPSETETKKFKKETRPFVCLSVCLSVCPLCLSGASILWVGEARCFVEILGGGIKIRDQPIDTRT